MGNSVVDWIFAAQVGSVGFGMVVALLCLLALTIWLSGMVVSKILIGKNENVTPKREA